MDRDPSADTAPASGDNHRGKVPARRARLVLIASALAWVAAMLGTAQKPGFGLGGWFSDHISHIHATALFFDEGTRIYTGPIRRLCRPVPRQSPARAAVAARLGVAPGDLCWPVARGPDERPLVINWPSFPRPYPPGQLLYFLPATVALNTVGFAAANALAVVLFVVVAHGCVYLVWLLAAPMKRRSVGWLVLGLSYLLLVPWAAVGVYDGVALLCLLASLHAGRSGRPVRALALGVGALFFHFRALWYLPLLAVQAARAAVHVRRGWARWNAGRRWRTVRLLAVTAVGAVLSLAVLAVVYPWLSRFPVTNVAHLSKLGSPLGWSLGLATVGCATLLCRQRRWVAAAVMLTTTAVVVQAPQAWPWHALFLLPLPLVADDPAPRQGEDEGAVTVALVWVVLVTHLVFRCMPGAELAALVRRLVG